MLPVLPDYLTTVLKSVGNFARFLRDTEYADTQAIADLEEISSRKGLGAAYGRTRAHQGFLSFAEGTLRGIYGSARCTAHLRALAKDEAARRPPRLHQLLPGAPEGDGWRDAVLAAFATSLSHGKDPVAMVHGYFYETAFAELEAQAERGALMEVLCKSHPAAALILLDRYRDLQRFPEVLRPLLRFGIRYFTENRYFEKIYDLGRFYREVFGLRGGEVGEVLERLWYAAFRLGHYDAALEVLAHWAALRPTQTLPLVNRALVLSVTDPAAAQEVLEDAGAPFGRATVGGNVFYVEQALRDGRLREAEQAIRHALHEARAQGEPDTVPPDYLIALHNVLVARGRPSRALDGFLAKQDLKLRWDGAFGLDTVTDVSPTHPSDPTPVAVVMTAYQAETYLARAIQGVLGQSHQALELIVVDDCSDDRTAEIIQEAAAQDDRVTYLRTPRNMGTYAAKNMGIRHALTRSPAFVTLCDSDDFWLRNHLAVHLAEMANSPELVCSLSQWVRLRDDGTVEVRLRGRYVEACPHSTFFRADVFEAVGFFDAVRFGADREYLTRLSLHFGRAATRRISRVLTLGRRHDASLTTSGAGAISEFNESPVRLQYWKGWNEWHLERIRRDEVPQTDGDPEAPRPFPAPPEMLA